MDMSSATEYGQSAVPSASAGPYSDARAHELRARYLATFGGDEIPVPVRSIAEDLLGLRVEQADLGDCSGVLLPAERLILLNAREASYDGEPTQRHRFTIAHELGHWICHAREGQALDAQPTYCRSQDIAHDVDRALEREANVFAAELLLPEGAVRAAWARLPSIAAAADHFRVSRQSAHWRLFSFGLVNRPPV
jgi:hypothetical protein